MVKNTRRVQRGEASLSRERIIEASVELLDSKGEGGLTFRALAERLASGAGAIYWHIADKDDLLNAACDSIVAATMQAAAAGDSPRQAIRAIGAGMFDAIDAHPWVGTELTRASWKMPMVRILEGIGRQVTALGMPPATLQPATFVLLHYILGVAGQNAANAQTAREQGFIRDQFLDTVANTWSSLDAGEFAFVRSVTGHLRDHDDRADFLAGIDLILAGLMAGHPPATGLARKL